MRRVAVASGVIILAGGLLFALLWPKNELPLTNEFNCDQPDLAVSGRNVYVCFVQDGPYGTAYNNVYFQRSSDNGRNWLTKPVRLDRRPGIAGTVHRPRIAVSGAFVYVVWRDLRDGQADIYLNYSADHGRTWQPVDIRLDRGDQAGRTPSFPPEIAATGSRVYVAWPDRRKGKADVFFNVSSDYGKTWLAVDRRLDGGLPGSADSSHVRLAAVDNKVYVVWEDDRNGKTDIYLNSSTTSGRVWRKAPVRLDCGDAAGRSEALNPQLAASQTACYVVWEDYRNTNADIYLNHTQNAGASWKAEDIRLDLGDPAGAHDSMNPQVAAAGNTVYVVWEDFRKELAPGPFIYLALSRNRATTWSPNETALDSMGYSVTQAYPQIRTAANQTFVVWRYGVRDKHGNTKAFIGMNFSKDKGQSWEAQEYLLNPLHGPYMWSVEAPRLACAPDYVHAVWAQDASWGPIYYNGGNITTLASGRAVR
jgi:hypothetical protein